MSQDAAVNGGSNWLSQAVTSTHTLLTAPAGQNWLPEVAASNIYDPEYLHQIGAPCNMRQPVIGYEGRTNVGIDHSQESHPVPGFNVSPEHTVHLPPANHGYWDLSPFPHSTITQISFFKERVILGSFAINTIGPVSLQLNTRKMYQHPREGAWTGGSTLSRAYVTSTLRSYPMKMVLNDRRLPPFIHPQLCALATNGSQVRDQLETTTPHPLAVCASIMRMYSAKSRASSAFIWRTIQMEQQRLELEVCHKAMNSSYYPLRLDPSLGSFLWF
jgi:hypothetical protein